MSNSPTPASRVLLRLIWASLPVLLGMHLLGWWASGRFAVESWNLLLDRFNLLIEGTVPAWFSAALLLVIGLAWIWRGDQPAVQAQGDRWRHRLLAACFIYVSCDESVSLHELAIEPVRDALQLGGLLYYAWVVPAAVVLVAVAVLLWPMLMRLPVALRRGTLLAGGVYLSGALGMEMVGGALRENIGMGSFAYLACSTVEEMLEITGLLIMTTALYHHAAPAAASVTTSATAASDHDQAMGLHASSAAA